MPLSPPLDGFTLAIGALARRFPRLALDGPAERDPRIRFRGFRRLPVRRH